MNKTIIDSFLTDLRKLELSVCACFPCDKHKEILSGLRETTKKLCEERLNYL